MSESLKNHHPFAFLEEYRGTEFNGEWPTVAEMFTITVKRYGNRPCFTDFDGLKGAKRSWSYDEIYSKVTDLAAWFVENGIVHGDRIALTGKNSPEWAVVYLAALYAGAIICPMDYALHDSELDNLINRAEPKFLFVDTEKFDHYFSEKKDFKVYALNEKNRDSYVFDLKPKGSYEKQTVSDTDTAAILFTSGTTGVPKGVMLSHKNLVSDCYIAQTHMILYPTDVFYALLPIHHAYTMLAVFIEAISVGAEVVFGKSMAVSRLMKELKEGKITMLLGVPLLFNKLSAGIMKGIRSKGLFVYGMVRGLMGLSYFIKKVFKVNPGKKMFRKILEQANLYTVRIAICGGGPLSKGVFKLYNEMGIDFVQGYGLTETSPIIALNPVQHFKIESVGSYFAGNMEMKILNPDEKGVGEICVKGPMVMQGYYKMPEETKAMFTEDGWLKTGDLGWLDKENYLMLSGRAKNMIVTEGGKNVYPEEIEDAFQLVTDIQQITIQGYVMDKATKSEGLEALIYVSDELLGKLFVERKDAVKSEHVNYEVKVIVEKINKTLQPYQRISKITLLEEPLEMTTTMKVKRNYKK